MTSALTARQQQALELLGRFGKVSRRTAKREGFKFETFQALVKHGLAAERPVSGSAGSTATVIVSLDGGQ